jgi:predicted ATPase
MTTLEHLRIRGYRRLYDVDLAMKPFNLLIGTNGMLSVLRFNQGKWRNIRVEIGA